MSHPQPRRLNSLFGTRAPKERRPTGVSRKRKKQLGFESLEARQVMSATPLASPNYSPSAWTGGTISSGSTQGMLDTLARELYWQSILTNSSVSTAAVTNSVPTDPYLGQQWHLVNSGQQVGNPDFQAIYGVPGEDINVAPVWNMGYTGAGVTVAVIDSGVQLNHPDLAANINLELALDALSINGNGSPNVANPINAHGTAVAGLIGAVANNGLGGVGVAPGVSLVPIRLIDVGQSEQAFIDAFRHAIQDIDITNNSWGPGVVRGLAGPTASELLALRDSVIFGRGGLGVIHVFSSGNDGGPAFNEGFQSIGGFDSSAYNGWVNSRYTIGVTGVDHDGFYNNVDGTITVYPEVSSSVLVAAPTGSNAGPVITNDTGIGSGLITTDLTGDDGFNAAPDPVTGQETEDPFYPFDRDFLSNTDYTSRMNGTSASAPLVSGVIALMLEANPNLSWRDVQEILVRSARQNAQFGVPQSGQGQGSGFGTQNTWIVNQVPVFHDPDRFVTGVPVDPLLRTMAPTLNPNAFLTANGLTSLNPDHYVATPFQLTNGSGYTVSQGVGYYGEQVGYAHGVVDAEMAVRLAEQWSTKEQTLPSELTFTSYVEGPGVGSVLNIPAAEKGSEDSGYQIVPGGIGGAVGGGFIDYWNEFFVADPDFTQDFSYRGDSSIEFNVPANNNMRVETVEVKVSLTGGTVDALDHLRIMLVSPEGTQSELNDYWIEDPGDPFSFQLEPLSDAIVYGTPGSVDTTGGNLVWTFSTNRNWGERANDAIVYDPVTGEPAIDELGLFGGPDRTAGQALTQGWRVVIENYDFQTAFGLAGIEVAFHGSPINANTQRIQGFVGVDDNRDDQFNFSRVIQSNVDLDGDASIVRLGEVINQVDLTQESFAGNVTVVARRASDNVVVGRFVTGHDGNYYFDLVPDDYIISIEDPEGRVAQNDALTPAGRLQDYKSEWLITEDYFKVWDKVPGSPSETVIDADGVPVAWLDDNGDEQVTGMKGINFLLDPGDPPAQQVEFSGVVYADANGDGIFNGNDIALPNATIFGDVNRNGLRDAGEIVVTTNASGAYNLVVPTTAAGVMNVGIVPPAQWTATNPAAKIHTRYVTPGDEFTGLDFYIKPPADNVGGGGINQPGILMGVIFQDQGASPNGQREASEPGAPGFTVYIDANNNGVLDAGDTSTVTNQHGAYIFTNVAPGQRVVRVVTPSPFQLTTPTAGRYTVQLTGSSTISSLVFGIKDTATLDYGDLPAIYNSTTAAQNGARHKKGVYFLGSTIDGELNGNPTANADGDDTSGFDDEDGIVFDPIVAGSTVRLIATASRNNGYLKGWIDWNGDGDFDDANERLVFSGIGSPTNNVLLSAGANQLFINVPAGVNVANVYARFRYGEQTLNSIFGEAQIGEVEDYLLPVAPPAIPAIVGLPADFTGDGRVDGMDFLTWQRHFGATSGAGQAQGSTNGDGDVDKYDLEEWKIDFGSVVSVASLTTEEDLSDAPQTLAVEFQGVSTFTAAADQSFSSALRSTGSSLGLTSVSPVVSNEATARFESRPNWATIAGKLNDVADRLRQRVDALDDRLEEGRDFVVELLHDVADRVDNFDFESIRRDRAFDDLFGSRRRQGLKVEADAAAGEETDADDAFAMFADHFEVPRG